MLKYFCGGSGSDAPWSASQIANLMVPQGMGFNSPALHRPQKSSHPLTNGEVIFDLENWKIK